MARGDIVRAHIERIASGGEGMALLENRKIFAPFTAPGDLVRLEITEEHGNWARARIVEIEEASPLRTEPVCPLYGKCGGCSLQHIQYEAQLQIKKEIILDCFSRIAQKKLPDGAAFAAEPKTACPPAPFGYRNRIQFHCLPNDRSLLGFKTAGGQEIVPVSSCPVAEKRIQHALKQRSIKPPPEKDRFTVYSRNETFLSEGGKSRGRVSILGKELLMDAGLFFQSNAAMLEVLIEDLQKAAADTDRSLSLADLYCGVGTFAAFLSEGFSAIELVEKNKAALHLARENVSAAHKNARFFTLSGDEWAKKQDKSGNKKYGFMIADPPREGLSPLLKKWLRKNGPLILAYISCNPAALARDAKELSGQNSYFLKELIVYDFYPQTAHIESLALFYRDEIGLV